VWAGVDLVQERCLIYLVKGFDNLLPLSTTHSMTPWKS
jgi:hypothetical protein